MRSPHQDIFTALRVMPHHQISHLPIVDDKDNLLPDKRISSIFCLPSTARRLTPNSLNRC
ncbi:MAG: hypothetical protein ACFB2X_17725 [Rivularia sp. (in: cyanobacteria)]